jgi:hypothetical protein
MEKLGTAFARERTHLKIMKNKPPKKSPKRPKVKKPKKKVAKINKSPPEPSFEDTGGWDTVVGPVG